MNTPLYTPVQLARYAKEAEAVSMGHVTRKFNVSYTTVRKAMRIHGVVPRRVGNFTNKELEAMK